MRPSPAALGALGLLTAILSGCDRPTAAADIENYATGPVQLINFDASGNALVRLDVDGDQVDAHGGEIRRFGDLYYWYAETYGCGFEWQKHAPSPFCGFRLYTSPDLSDWTDRGLLFDVSNWDPWQARCNWWTMGCFRPHVIYNAMTRKYVLWVNSYDTAVGYHVLQSDSARGPFVEVAVPHLAFDSGPPGEVNNGDENLFVDEDGIGYVVYAEWRVRGGDIVVERLTPDFLSGTGVYVRVGAHHSEAPSLFKRNGRYYLIASTPPNWAYGQSSTSYVTAPRPLGPWSRPRQISPNSCGGQAAHVAQLPTASGGSWYLLQIDLWLNSDNQGAGDPNQGPASQFWAPLSFDSEGNIGRVACRPSYGVDARTAGPPDSQPPMGRLVCDIGAATGNEVKREFRVTANITGTLRSIGLPVYQRGEPDAPLVMEVRSTDGLVLDQREIRRSDGEWSHPPTIQWAARRLQVQTNIPVTAGQEIDVRLGSSTRRGCYGFASRSNPPLQVEARVSTDAGITWTNEYGRGPRLEIGIEGP